MNGTMPSRASWLVIIGGFAAVALMAALIAFGGSENLTSIVSNVGGFLVTSAAAVVALSAALAMEPGSPVRAQWLPIGLGMACFAIGDGIWAYYPVVAGADAPWPGLADLAYVAGYPLIAYGVMRAALAWRGRARLLPSFIIAALSGVVGAVALWFLVVKPSVIGQGLSGPETAISVFYPIADILFGLVPALFVILVLGQLGGGRLSWPWLAVGGGVLLYSAADALYAVLNARGTYAEGNIVDYGWAAGYVLVAVGASLAFDLARPRVKVPAPSGAVA